MAIQTKSSSAQLLGDVPVGTVVKLNESGDPVEFIVIQQGSPSDAYYGFENVTTVLRKDIHSKRVIAHDNNDYENSEINSWLNGEYLSLFDEDIHNAVQEVKIPYRPGSGGSGNIDDGVDGLLTKAFLLSMNEVNLNENSDIPPGWTPKMGTTLSYFVNSDNLKRIAKLDGIDTDWWSRSPDTLSNTYHGILVVSYNGYWDNTKGFSTQQGVRPTVPLSSNLRVLDDGTVFDNFPPTAPGSIDVTGVLRGETATITLTAATDPDGTVASYRYERQIDGGEWTQFADVNSLTQTDTIGEDWGTVAYRAAAVDNLGLQGPYITGETFTVNSGWVTIGGPAEDMGSQPRQFDFDFSVSVSGVPSVDAITVSAALDGKQIYSGTPSAGEQISVPIDTRLLGAGEHAIEVQASKDDYLPGSKRYTFTVPAVTIPAGGTGEQAQGPDGRPVFHTTLAQRCIGTGGVDIQAQVDALAARVKTLEG